MIQAHQTPVSALATVIAELGYLGAGDGNMPAKSGTLFRIDVNAYGWTGTANLTIAADTMRGGVVSKDTNATTTATNLPVTIPVVFPAICTTPTNEVGQLVATATGAWTTQGFTGGFNGTAVVSCANVGLVITNDQNCVSLSTPINYTYGIHSTVPNEVNVVLATAETAITNAQLSVGTVTTACSNTIPSGRVISTSPVGGTSYCGVVTIVESNGPCVAPDCFPSSDPNYGQWVSVGKPASWCGSNLRQCHGDADNATQLVGKSNYWVSPNDLAILVAGWEKAYTNPTACPWISADFDHKGQVVGKSTYRVSPNDLAILVQYWEKATVPNNCPHN